MLILVYLVRMFMSKIEIETIMKIVIITNDPPRDDEIIGDAAIRIVQGINMISGPFPIRCFLSNKFS